MDAWTKTCGHERRCRGNFIQREPRFGMPATEPTEFRVLYDDRTLYFGVWVWDSDPDGIIGSEMKRDAGLRKGDQIKIIIDTFHDHRNAFYFITNPLGAYKDAQTVENGRTINYDWNAVWKNETSIDEHGLVHRDGHPAQPAAVHDHHRPGHVGTQHLPHSRSARTRNRTGCRFRASGARRLRARVERRRAHRPERSEVAAAHGVRPLRRCRRRRGTTSRADGIRRRRECTASTSAWASPTTSPRTSPIRPTSRRSKPIRRSST